MYVLDQGFKKWAKITCRAGQVLAIVLVWQTTHTAAADQFGSTVHNFSQVVINGGSTTSFTIHNPNSEKTIDVDVQLYSPAGGKLTDGQVELGPGETETVSFGDASAPLTRGWAELKSESEFIATEFFQLFLGGLKPRVGVLPSPLAEEIKFLGFINDEIKSGLAVHNPSPTEATELTLRLKDKGGQQPVTEKTLTLNPLQSEAAFLNEALLFGPSLTSFEGVVEITANSPPVAVLSLIQEASGDVATVAVETANFIITDPTNTAIGRGALSSNPAGINNTATGAGALMRNTTGFGNTASGHNALSFNTEGIGNTASGNSALAANNTGGSNTASGAGALFRNTSGSGNTASGHDALFSNTTGGSNTAIGDQALRSNTEGNENTAVGVAALTANNVGRSNVATGTDALRNNTTGSFNTASGPGALFSNIEGSHNAATGNQALTSNKTGNNNTANGSQALRSNTIGSSNIAIGNNAGSNLVTGNNNIYVGNTGAEESNIIRIGNSDHTNAFMAGVQIVAPSSRRFKKDIHDMDDASGDLMRLRPVTFRYKRDFGTGGARLQYGLIAEEVADVYPELIVNDETGQPRTVEYQKLNVMLLNELQKQSRQIRVLTERLAHLEREETAEVSEVLH